MDSTANIELELVSIASNREDFVDLRYEIASHNLDTSDVEDSPEGNSLLTIILGSAAVVQLVKSIHYWILSQRKKTIIKVKVKDTEIEIESENLKDEKGMNDLVKAILKAAK